MGSIRRKWISQRWLAVVIPCATGTAHKQAVRRAADDDQASKEAGEAGRSALVWWRRPFAPPRARTRLTAETNCVREMVKFETRPVRRIPDRAANSPGTERPRA
jgi:hypothetical protein